MLRKKVLIWQNHLKGLQKGDQDNVRTNFI